MLKRNRPVHIAARTLSRRTWMEWLGKSAVLSLGAGLLAQCGGDPAGEADASDRPDAGPDSSVADAGPDAAQTPLCADPAGELPFEPGTLEGFADWGERTVDEQDLSWILQHWRLTVDGLVDTPRSLSFADLFCLDRQDQIVDFHCVEGWSIYDVPWNGIHMQTLFDQVGVQPTASYVAFHTIDGVYNESLPLEIALEPKTLLAYGIDGNTLPLKHGFPLRVVIPRLLGYKNAKYVHRIELTDRRLEGFWVQAGYPYDGLVPEDRLRPGKY